MKDLKILSALVGVFTLGVIVSFSMALKTSIEHKKSIEAQTKPIDQLALPATAN